MPDYEEIERLGEDIRHGFEMKDIETATFLPDNMVQVFASQHEVTTALEAVGLEQKKGLVNFILTRARRIFLILVLLTEDNDEKLSRLQVLMENDIDDHSLPLKLNWSKERKAIYAILPDGYEIDLPGWKKTERDLFSKWQWAFTSPVFKDKFHFSFHQSTRLPFTSRDPPVGEGFFGEVSKVQVSSAHVPGLGLKSSTTKVTVALKRIKDEVARKYLDLVIKERANLQMLSTHGYKSPYLIKPIASYEHNGDSYLIFPWADGGTLLSYRASFSNRPAKVEDIRWIIKQFTGLFSALKELHNTNCRHGDLKPDNILWFKNDGILQIADLGLATFHKLVTEIRKQRKMQTMTPSGNLRYSPPEMGEDGNTTDARSRVYDTWSLGCVLLEMLVWIAYGPAAVSRFENLTDKSFWIKSSEDQEPRVHSVVNLCMEVLGEDLLGCDAFGDILGLVRKGLLVTSVDDRMTASHAHSVMAKIWNDCESDPSYRVFMQSRFHFPITEDGKKGQLRGVLEDGYLATENFDPESLKVNYSMVSNHQEYPIPFRSCNLDNIWRSFPDNEFAASLLQKLDWNRVRPRLPQDRTDLCTKCSNLQALPLFEDSCDTSSLQETCGLCGLLLKGLKDAGVTVGEVARLRQTATAIGLKDGPNLISLYVEPGPNIPPGSQIGLPQLLEQASHDQFTLLEAWMQVCDSDHENCRRKYDLDGFSMPTRLIEVGEPVRLILSSSIKPSRYVALSHCWGRLEESQKFCTYRNNIEQLKESINLERIPQTFMDAITVTRGLGIKYIWIDSLCIIQDDNTDWENEAQKMEQVYSAAYCTIGASSAKSSLDGFLAHRPLRPWVKIQTDDMGPLYACQAIDDFHGDVELSELNSRGWVLQERALSRRSIFFSTAQVYWECGNGIHCETLARLSNSKASFLGDANFPASALAYYRDGRQVLIQDLYERYSGLAFTKPSDRSVAILGLQKRLERALKTRAAYGFFKSYFARGLLWKRGQEKDLTPIKQQTGDQPPSWSWFCKEGVIEYLGLGFKEIDWATDDYESPFESEVSRHSVMIPGSGDEKFSLILRGLGRLINMSWDDTRSNVTFDRKQQRKPDELRCVIIGRDRAIKDDLNHQMVHVLVIARSESNQEADTYERIGVASLLSSWVASKGSWVNIS